jgi:nickel/cobalt transporter (NicO) family protein
MLEGMLYLATSFWLGALHAATPGHGKTISAAYLVGMRGRPVDAAALGIFVTLAHTGGIVLFGLLATLGSVALSQQGETYGGLLTAVLILALGLQMLYGQRHVLAGVRPAPDHDHAHGHGWGRHTHDHELKLASRPSWAVLLGLGVAGGLLPDPGAMAVLLGAISTGKLVLGLCTVLVFSLGFASVLVVAGLAIGRLGQWLLARAEQRWIERAQALTALVIVVVGVLMTVGSIRQLGAWR